MARQDQNQVVYVDGDVPQLPLQLGQLLVDSSQISTGVTNLQQCTSQDPLIYTPIAGRPQGDIRNYGASTTATPAQNSAALQAAIDANNEVYTEEAYTFALTAITLHSNMKFVFGPEGEWIREGGGVGAAPGWILGTGLTNIEWKNPRITGNGEEDSPGVGGHANIVMTNCTKLTYLGGVISKAGAHGIQHDSCSYVFLRGTDLTNNYYYGVSDTLGFANLYFAALFEENGDTTIASSAFGRGINFWMCVGCYAVNCWFIRNTEYGFRIYSQVGDLLDSYANQLLNSYFEDNVRADVVLYDEGVLTPFVYRNLVVGNIAVRTTDPTLGVSFLLHGDHNTTDDCHVYNDGAFGTFTAFYMFDSDGNEVLNSSCENTQQAINLSTTSQNCVVDNFEGRGVAVAVQGLPLAGHRVLNSRFTHGGSGTTDVGIVTYNATGRCYIEGTTLDGFDVGIDSEDEALTLINNTTLNSGTAGWRKAQDAQSTQVVHGNNWDSTSPAFLQYLNRPVSGGPAEFRTNADPASLTWAVSDRYVYTPAAIGSPKAKTCTTGGTGGAATWTSEGNL